MFFHIFILFFHPRRAILCNENCNSRKIPILILESTINVDDDDTVDVFDNDDDDENVVSNICHQFFFLFFDYPLDSQIFAYTHQQNKTI